LYNWQIDSLIDKAVAECVIPREDQTIQELAIQAVPRAVVTFEESMSLSTIVEENEAEPSVSRIEIGTLLSVPKTKLSGYKPVIPTIWFSATPNFKLSGTEWRFRYQVNDFTPIDELRIRIPESRNGQFYAYVDALTEQLPNDYWKTGYGLLVEGLYQDHSVFEELRDEPDAVSDLIVTGRSRPGDVLVVLIKLFSAIVTNRIPVDKIWIVSMEDVRNVKIRIFALPIITGRHRSVPKREAGHSINWINHWDNPDRA
jgi:hypothetical protein